MGASDMGSFWHHEEVVLTLSSVRMIHHFNLGIPTPTCEHFTQCHNGTFDSYSPGVRVSVFNKYWVAALKQRWENRDTNLVNQLSIA